MPLIKATDKVLNLASGSINLDKLIQNPSDLFVLTLSHDSTTPTSDGTLRFGQASTLIAGTSSAVLTRQVIMPYAATLLAASIAFIRSDTISGTAGTSSMLIRNNTTAVSTTLSTTLDYFNNTSFNSVYTGFTAFSVAANDNISGNWVVPVYTTYPTSVRHFVNLWFKRILA